METGRKIAETRGRSDRKSQYDRQPEGRRAREENMTYPGDPHEPNRRRGRRRCEIQQQQPPDELDGVDSERVGLGVEIPLEGPPGGEHAGEAVNIQQSA